MTTTIRSFLVLLLALATWPSSAWAQGADQRFNTVRITATSSSLCVGVAVGAACTSAAGDVYGGTLFGLTKIEVGHASDTTISRVSAGLIAVEGIPVALTGTANTFTAKQTVSFAQGTDFLLEIAPTTAATPYGLLVRGPSTPGSGYPLILVSNNAGTVDYFRVDSGTGKTLFGGPAEIANGAAINELVFTGTDSTNVLSATTGTFQIGGTAAGAFSILTNNTARLNITSGGLMGFNRANGGVTSHEFAANMSIHDASNPSFYMYVGSSQYGAWRASTADLTMGTTQSIPLSFYTANTTWLTIGSAGNVGIASGRAILWDGTNLAGDTYTYHSASNTLDDVVGGVTTLRRTAGTVTVFGAEGGASTLNLTADEGDDAADVSTIAMSAGNTLSISTTNLVDTVVGAVIVTRTEPTGFSVLGAEGASGIFAIKADEGDDASDTALFTMSTGGTLTIDVDGLLLTSSIVVNGSISSLTNDGFTLGNGSFGSAAMGQRLLLGRNVDGTHGAAGNVTIVARDNTQYPIWVDVAGNVRVKSGPAPTSDNSVSDTGGTVVGTQTSRLSSKTLRNNGFPLEDDAHAFAVVVRTPVYLFSPKAFPAEEWRGVVLDYSPEFGMDENRSFNPATAFGYSVQAFRHIDARLSALEARMAQIAELKARVAALEGGR